MQKRRWYLFGDENGKERGGASGWAIVKGQCHDLVGYYGGRNGWLCHGGGYHLARHLADESNAVPSVPACHSTRSTAAGVGAGRIPLRVVVASTSSCPFVISMTASWYGNWCARIAVDPVETNLAGVVVTGDHGVGSCAQQMPVAWNYVRSPDERPHRRMARPDTDHGG